jgi:hypothetical protein
MMSSVLKIKEFTNTILKNNEIEHSGNLCHQFTLKDNFENIVTIDNVTLNNVLVIGLETNLLLFKNQICSICDYS